MSLTGSDHKRVYLWDSMGLPVRSGIVASFPASTPHCQVLVWREEIAAKLRKKNTVVLKSVSLSTGFQTQAGKCLEAISKDEVSLCVCFCVRLFKCYMKNFSRKTMKTENESLHVIMIGVVCFKSLSGKNF